MGSVTPRLRLVAHNAACGAGCPPCPCLRKNAAARAALCEKRRADCRAANCLEGCGCQRLSRGNRRVRAVVEPHEDAETLEGGS